MKNLALYLPFILVAAFALLVIAGCGSRRHGDMGDDMGRALSEYIRETSR